MKKTCLLAMAAGAACCSIALAKPPLEMARPGAELTPVSIAKVKKVDGKIVLAGEWIPYTGGNFNNRNPVIDAPAFDDYGREGALAPPGTAGTGCPIACDTTGTPDGGGRWYFGSAYENPNTVEDAQDWACPASSLVDEIDLGFFWAVPAPSPLYIVYFPYNEVMAFNPITGACNDPATFTDTGGGGVVLFYGNAVPPSTPFYYFSRPTGLVAAGITMMAPATDKNGDPKALVDGSYQMIIASAVTSSQITLASGPTQPMLWGTSQTTGDCRPGFNNADSYDDDNPTNGILAPNECYSYAYGLCPDPLGKDNCFCYLRCPADYNNDGFVDGSDSDAFNNDFAAGSPCADLTGDCFVDGSDSDLFNNQFASPCP